MGYVLSDLYVGEIMILWGMCWQLLGFVMISGSVVTFDAANKLRRVKFRTRTYKPI